MNWILLIIGGVFEAGFAVSLGKAQNTLGKEKWIWLASFIVCVSISMYLLYRSMGGSRPIPVGTAYAVWAGIGAVCSVLFGIFIFSEPATVWRMVFLSTLIVSLVGL
ncbi:MAG: QacE family quaternary ammonium compound efflux SMR transporter, partial [Bacteroidales bacterium]|nr:QacE family quaternary ammonium compound efflux SMR transporter [Bacteroidales bacterium]